MTELYMTYGAVAQTVLEQLCTHDEDGDGKLCQEGAAKMHRRMRRRQEIITSVHYGSFHSVTLADAAFTRT